MAIVRDKVISRLKAGEHLMVTLPKGDCEAERPIYFLSRGGASNSRNVYQTQRNLKAYIGGVV